MSRHFTAVLLLEKPVDVDIDRLALTVMEEFPQIGWVEPVAGQVGQGRSGILRIEGGHVVVTLTHQPFPEEEFFPELQVLRTWDPVPVLAGHGAYLTVSCGGGLEGIEGAEAYAAAVHFVTAAACSLLPGLAVFWQRGFTITTPEDFCDASLGLLQGRMPLGAWVSFASIVPRGYVPAKAQGMVTYGMLPFIGRELELAPRPGNTREAYDCIAAIARNTLDKGVNLTDGQRYVTSGATGVPMTVRERTYWLRRDQSAFVLVTDDSVVDTETLRPRVLPAA